MKLNGKESVRIAVTYEDGEIFQHFGQTKQFKFYDTEDGKVIDSKVVEAGAEHCALGSFLYEEGVSVLICGNLGMGASKSLQAAGILVYGGNRGSADEAVDLLLQKKLVYNPLPNCGGHDHSHGCGHHNNPENDQDESSSGHNHFEGGHNHQEEENAGHNARTGYER